MARLISPSCKLCRREQTKLYLKGFRCTTAKCAIEKRNYAPGQHGRARARKPSDYGMQLREKQKMKRMYGILEKQFRLAFKAAAGQKGITGENLIRRVEQRLDNAVYRLMFAGSRAESRQLVCHGHVLVNGKRVDIPSYQVKPGDVIEFKKSEKLEKRIRDNFEVLKDRVVPEWLKLDTEGLKGTVERRPEKMDAGLPVEESMIVELYSK